MRYVLFVPTSQIGIFFELLATGFQVKTKTGVSVREFLERDLAIDPKYVDACIQTIFLNGRAIDNIEQATLTDGASLALSGAMPGLAGAVFRRGGVYAPMRGNASSSAPLIFTGASSEGSVVVKLFNQVAADLGPFFLKKGIWIPGQQLLFFLRHHWEKLERMGVTMEVDGRKFLPQQFMETDISSQDVCLIIQSP